MSSDNKLHLSWHDNAWIPILQPSNILEYFSQRTNPFYDRTCNNEVVRMQRRELSVLKSMTGLEYELLHVQGNFLYIVRKQYRRSPTEVTPLANYYILNGIVYQAPDLRAVVSSRTFSSLYHLNRAFDEIMPRTQYHPTSGYLWDFEQAQLDDFKKKEASTEQRSSRDSKMQHDCVQMILYDLAERFPPPAVAQHQPATEVKPSPAAAGGAETSEATVTPSAEAAGAAATKDENGDKLAAGDTSHLDSAAKRPRQSGEKLAAGDANNLEPAAKRPRLA